MKHLYLFFGLTLFFGLKINAQINCATTEVNDLLMSQDKNFAKSIIEQGIAWKKHNENGTVNKTLAQATVTVPVVFHIIHTGQAIGSVYNPADSTLQKLVTLLNNKFAATYTLNPDTLSGGVNVPIRFKLAARTPSCTTTTGINRINASGIPAYVSDGIGYGQTTVGEPELNIKALSIWPNKDYLNIWIVTNISGSAANGGAVAGFAYYPGATANKDGVVMRGDQTSWSIAHEVGHYFGLRHTFEGSASATVCPTNTNCVTDGDLVCDTDPHALESGCPTGINMCTGTSFLPVVYNYMNYSSCPNRFSQGQKTRAVFMLNNFRASLITSLGASSPTVNPTLVTAPIAACVPSLMVNPTEANDLGPRNVFLGDLTYNSAGYTNDNNQFYIDNTVATCNQSQKIAHVTAGNTYTLSATTGFNKENIKAWIDYDNNGVFATTEMVLNHLGTGANETHTAVVTVPQTTNTCKSLRMRVFSDFYPYTIGACNNVQNAQAEDFIVIINQTSTPTVAVSSPSAMCTNSPVTFTATTTNSGSNPFYQWKKNGVNFGANANTVTTSSLVTGNIIACVVTASVNCTNTQTITASKTLTVSTCVGIEEFENNKLQIQLYPNPVTQQLNLVTEFEFDKPLKVEITNALGQIVMVSDIQPKTKLKTIYLTELAKGMYVVKIASNEGLYTKTIIKN